MMHVLHYHKNLKLQLSGLKFKKKKDVGFGLFKVSLSETIHLFIASNSLYLAFNCWCCNIRQVGIFSKKSRVANLQDIEMPLL